MRGAHDLVAVDETFGAEMRPLMRAPCIHDARVAVEGAPHDEVTIEPTGLARHRRVDDGPGRDSVTVDEAHPHQRPIVRISSATDVESPWPVCTTVRSGSVKSLVRIDATMVS